MKRNLFISLSILIVGVVVLAACGGAPAQQMQTDIKSQTGVDAYGVGGQSPPVADSSVMPNFSYASGAGGGEPQSPVMEAPAPAVDQAAQNPSTADDRMVIKTANLSIVVDDTAKTVADISRLADSLGGYVVSLNTTKSTYGPQAQVAEQAAMTIRVPSAKLDDALSQLKGYAVDVNNESVSGQDVTSEYTDLQSRLTNLEAAEKQLQSIMEEATKTEDVLAVYNQLVATREQIEVIKGQMKYYSESAAMSAITLDIQPNIATQPIEVGGWRPEGVAKQALTDTVHFLQNFTDDLIYFSIARLPFLLIFGIPALLLLRWAWRRSRKTPAKPEPVAAAGTD
jgi:hypothetical protein